MRPPFTASSDDFVFGSPLRTCSPDLLSPPPVISRHHLRTFLTGTVCDLLFGPPIATSFPISLATSQDLQSSSHDFFGPSVGSCPPLQTSSRYILSKLALVLKRSSQMSYLANDRGLLSSTFCWTESLSRILGSRYVNMPELSLGCATFKSFEYLTSVQPNIRCAGERRGQDYRQDQPQFQAGMKKSHLILAMPTASTPRSGRRGCPHTLRTRSTCGI